MDAISYLERSLNITMKSFDMQIISIELLGDHAICNRLIVDLKQMAVDVLKNIEDTEFGVIQDIEKAAENLLCISGSFSGFMDFPKALGDIETKMTTNLSERFNVMKNATQVMIYKIDQIKMISI